MGKRLGLTGNEAVAYAVKQADVDVIAAYPITPQTVIVERLSEYVANGELDAAFVPVESEHSALSTVVGAAATGARVFTATCSQGLALMWEILYIASALRLPIVMSIAARALSAPINIHCDYSDVMGTRDAGWITLFAENVQEAYDNIVQAFRIAEDPEVLLPVMCVHDGFILSHCLEVVEVLEDEQVRNFLPRRDRPNVLDPSKPITLGPVGLPDSYMEFKRQQDEAMKVAYRKVKEVGKLFGELSGRYYDVVHAFGVEDADVVAVCMGSAAGTTRYVARKLREKGLKVGVLKIRMFRPFPKNEVRELLKGAKLVIAMDRATSLGGAGHPLQMELATTFYTWRQKPLIMSVVYGLGGRDLTPMDIERMFNIALEYAKKGEVPEEALWLGLRE
ncbi:MAG: pyruvate ferredoxin oxidoreductase [Thermoprotei archaeon]|nr:MAG: pyruvate ferredoxin oxidoreductase [Thermoprotei archaeon]